MFSNAGSCCISVEVDLTKIPHENLLLIFQHRRAQIRALRIRLSDNDFVRNRWDQLASYFSQPTEWPNLTELWVLSPSQKTLLGLMLQIPGVNSFHYCRKESDNLAWCAPMQQLTTLRLCHVPIDQCLYLLFHCPNLIEFHCSTQRIRIDTRTIFPPEAIFSPFSHTENLFESPIISLESRGWGLELIFLFSSIRLPNLEKLSWGVPNDSLRPQSTEPIDSVLIKRIHTIAERDYCSWLGYPSFVTLMF